MKSYSFKVYVTLAINGHDPNTHNPEGIWKCEKDVIHLANLMRSLLRFGGQIKTKYYHIWQILKEIILLPQNAIPVT